MARQKSIVTAAEVKDLLEQEGDFLKATITRLVQEALEAEMEDALQAARSERNESRLGYRSGYNSRSLITRIGKLELRIPQDRQGRFSTEIFERYQRKKALVSTLAEMHVQGVSTRKVKAITEELCGHQFSASAVSEITKRLDEQLKEFAQRRLDEPFPYLILDEIAERVAGRVRNSPEGQPCSCPLSGNSSVSICLCSNNSNPRWN